uniref:Uncharacterized protein n=1 Tax=Oryza punctata TaxID=4537 RepID=A0A0E0JLG8_ORYPU
MVGSKGCYGGLSGVWIHKCNIFALWWELFFLHNDEMAPAIQIPSGEVVAAGLVPFLIFDGLRA